MEDNIIISTIGSTLMGVAVIATAISAIMGIGWLVMWSINNHAWWMIPLIAIITWVLVVFLAISKESLASRD